MIRVRFPNISDRDSEFHCPLWLGPMPRHANKLRFEVWTQHHNTLPQPLLRPAVHTLFYLAPPPWSFIVNLILLPTVAKALRRRSGLQILTAFSLATATASACSRRIVNHACDAELNNASGTMSLIDGESCGLRGELGALFAGALATAYPEMNEAAALVPCVGKNAGLGEWEARGAHCSAQSECEGKLYR